VAERVYNVGRLDLASSGLVLFTNDGEFAAKAGHPSFGLIKEYEVETDGRVHPDFPAAFQRGLTEGGETLRAERVEQYGARRLRIWLAEGKNREIRRALGLYRLRARVLKRVAIGPVRIDGLAEGRWRSLTPAELAALNEIFSRKR
jgi:23S rRNA pseudouridine2605 synthase